MLFRNWNLLPASLNGQEFLGFSTTQPFFAKRSNYNFKTLHQTGMRPTKKDIL